MINLLPAELKTQIEFSKHNARVLGYIKALGGVALVVAGLFGYGEWYLASRAKQTQADLTARQAEIASFKKSEAEAKALNDRLAAIKALQGGQTRFSVVLADLAAHTPQGVFIDGVTLTGDDKKPVRISATLSRTSDAARLRDALATSSRISAVDIESVGQTTSGSTTTAHASIVIGYKPGMAR